MKKRTLWGHRPRWWRWRMARAYARVGAQFPYYPVRSWDGALTTTADLAADLASMTLEGMTARPAKEEPTK